MATLSTEWSRTWLRFSPPARQGHGWAPHLAACTESLLPAPARHALLAAEDTDTVTTRVFDAAQRYQWPRTIPERVLRNTFSDHWQGHEEELSADENAHETLAAAIAAHDHRQAPINAGQGVAMLKTVRPAAEVIDQLCAEASQLLGRWAAP